MQQRRSSATGWIIVELIALLFALQLVVFTVAAFQSHGPLPVLFMATSVLLAGVIAYRLYRRFA